MYVWSNSEPLVLDTDVHAVCCTVRCLVASASSRTSGVQVEYVVLLWYRRAGDVHIYTVSRLVLTRSIQNAHK